LSVMVKAAQRSWRNGFWLDALLGAALIFILV
jgi:hypothetical protein